MARYRRRPTYVEGEKQYDIEKDADVYVIFYESGHCKTIPAEKFEAEYEQVRDDEGRS